MIELATVTQTALEAARTIARCVLTAALLVGLAVSAAAAPAPTAGDELVVLEIEAPAELERYAVQLRDWRSERLWRFARLLGLEPEEDRLPLVLRVILVPESAAGALEAPRWVAGYARGDAGLVVLFPTRVPVYPDRSLEELLGHEVAHVLIHRAAAGRSLPRWFHEGLSMLAEEAWGIEDRSRVALALLRHGRSSLSELEARFKDPSQVARSYALAGAFVRDLVRREGADAPAELLDRVAAGETFDAAFAAATGGSLAEAEASFWRRFTFWYRWLPFLTSSTTLWMAVMLLALLAIRRRRQRDRALRERWDLEEAWEEERSRLADPVGLAEDPLEPIN